MQQPLATWSDGEDTMADAAILPLVTAERDRRRSPVTAVCAVPPAIRVVIADGQPLVRAGLQALLEAEDDVTVVGQAADGDEAARLAREQRPDVLLVDSELSGFDGVELTRLVLADPQLAGVHILVLSACESDERVLAALRAGIRGFLLKDGRLDHIADAVRAVASGDAALAPSVVRRLMAELVAQPDVRRHTPEQLEELTAREREVVALVAAGLSNGEIAEHLVVSPATAKTHVSRALCKMRARDRAQLVRLAYETGLVVARQAATVPPAATTLAAA
jgi:DNA-binding NarL/FixJ family response regulator